MSETRWPCPVCLGVKMEKTVVGKGEGGPDSLTLDHCARCGGMWFELGEVQRLELRAARVAVVRDRGPR